SATYTLSVSNLGPSDAQNVNVSDVLPDGLTVLSEKQLTGSDAFQNNTNVSNTASFFATTMAAGGFDTFEVVAFAPSNLAPTGKPLSATARAPSPTSAPNPANNPFVFGSFLDVVFNLSVTKTGPATVTAGTQATYTITVSNSGPSDAANLTLTDAIPAPFV